MPTTIQIRNVPDLLHRRIKSRAARDGLSISEFLPGEIGRAAERPTPNELARRLASRVAVKSKISPAEIPREYRGR
ncbi:MAG TPA: hypothetical protein VEV17_06415 [Bryobacteraceae bacterium]|nr:hypothetical protein [Bryobacteraceae bacterium]